MNIIEQRSEIEILHIGGYNTINARKHKCSISLSLKNHQIAIQSCCVHNASVPTLGRLSSEAFGALASVLSANIIVVKVMAGWLDGWVRGAPKQFAKCFPVGTKMVLKPHGRVSAAAGHKIIDTKTMDAETEMALRTYGLADQPSHHLAMV